MAAALGFLSGLGVGGGSLLILWLTIISGMEQTLARGINLLFFLPSALIACCFRCRQGTLRLRKVLPAVLSGCICSALLSWVGLRADVDLLKKAFGILLIGTGARELLYRPKEQ